MEQREQQPSPLQIEIREYGEVNPDLINLARTGISEVLRKLDIVQTKPLTLHITEFAFRDQYGVTFPERYESLPNQGNMYLSYDGGYRPEIRQQEEERYGIPADSSSKYIFLYNVCHSAVHYAQDLHGKVFDPQFSDLSNFDPDSPEYVKKYLEEPLEQEAHKIGLEVANTIKVDTPTIQVQIKSPGI